MQNNLREGGVARVFVLFGLLCLMFAGCERSDEPASAASAEPKALMKAAFPGWKPDGPLSVRLIESPREPGKAAAVVPASVGSYALSPGLVIALAAERVVLIVHGVPANDTGVPQAGHASTALLGAHWFEKRGERWVKVAEQPEFAQEGYFGVAGDLHGVDLGDGRQALAVENGSCWQGACGRWLSLYAIGEQHIDMVFSELLTSNTRDASESCGELIDSGIGQQKRVPLESFSLAFACYEITGKWEIQPATSGSGSPVLLLINFTGRKTSEEGVSVEPSPGKSIANTEKVSNEKVASEETDDDEAPEERLVTVHELRQRQVYRFEKGRFVLFSGTNPNPGL